MRRFLCVCAAFLVLAGVLGAQAASYHDAKYLVGGYPRTTSTFYHPGIYILDLTGPTPTLTQLVVPDYYAYGFDMDADNRKIVFACLGAMSTLYGPIRNGLFRYDPATNTLQTIWQHPPSTVSYTSFYHVMVDQNGDYIVNGIEYSRVPTPKGGYYLWKIDQNGNRTTIATTTSLGRPGYWYSKTNWNVDSGKLLLPDGRYQTSPTTIRYCVLEVDTETGAIGSFNDGSVYGWYGFYNTPQNYRNGFIEGPYSRYLFQLKPGSSGRTTLFTLTTTTPYFYGGADFDLQSAAKQRIVAATYYSISGTRGGALMYIDRATGAVTTILHSAGAYLYAYDFAFYRGRHTQTAKIGKRQWQILFSAPRFAGKPYVAAMGISGVRPGIPLASGRVILLNPDPLVFATLLNLMPFFNAGPGKLDANGDALGKLDLSALPTLGIPAWIQWLVLDPQAPDGIAYIPDPYPIRI